MDADQTAHDCDRRARPAGLDFDFELALLECERMTERDQLGSALCGHDARQYRGVEYRALLRAMAAAAQGACNDRRQIHARFSLRHAMGHWFCPDVDHRGTRTRIQMRESGGAGPGAAGHDVSPPRDSFRRA